MGSCVLREILRVKASRRGLISITDEVNEVLARLGGGRAVNFVHLFLRHTSAALILQENADPSARHDLELFFERLVPVGQEGFLHTDEGPDDMPGHIKTVLMNSSLLIPACSEGLMLGRWQGIYLWEHRMACPQREIVVSLLS